MEAGYDAAIVERDARAFLREEFTAVVATAFENQPFVSTVYYVVDDDAHLYFAAKRNTAKVANLSANSKVAFVVGTGPAHISVQGRGTASFLFGKERAYWRGELRRKKSRGGISFSPTKHMKIFVGKDDVVVKITPTELLFLNLDSEKYPSSTSREYHRLLPKAA